ncbi:hypothetical protein AAFF_G00022100 [Aldrovandia affinis]|uniref:Uncharacterized protein n=1 Tax=Aldrovandia affinis TaxID=143900 RepID=A0AAD7S542_9TELE|nr:hypothetical protein AAFF_G00022100 [Aldrovandia affinis]
MQGKFWFLATLVLGTCAFFAAQPLHAQCKVIWVLKVPCLKVEEALVNQIQQWTTSAGCVTEGEKCQYELISANHTQIIAKHTTALDRNVDIMHFYLKSDILNLNCRLVGISASQNLERVHDNGTNYCNIYNLVDGSGLTSVPEFKEISNDWMCTQRSIANCTLV